MNTKPPSTEEITALLHHAGVSDETLARVAHELDNRPAQREPDEYDRMWQCPTVPPAIESHFVHGELLPRVLDPSRLWPGHHYTLTRGQRQLLAETGAGELAPTITIGWVEVFPGTRHPAAFQFVSDRHNPYRRSDRLRTAGVITRAGKWFYDAMCLDSAHKEKRGRKNVIHDMEHDPVRTLEALEAELRREAGL
jgi:hypothetical protein